MDQTAAQLRDLPSGRLVRACGIVVMRQQPQTAKGAVFVTLEDETGSVNVIVWKSLREKQRGELLHSRLLAVYGVWKRDGESGSEVRHLIAQRLVDLTPLLGGLRLRCGDCGHDKLVAFSCMRCGFCLSSRARRMAQTAVHLVHHVIPHVLVRQWVLSLPIPLRLL